MSTSLGKRLEYGFQAWQMTLGYMCKHHSPDVLLKIQAEPGDQKRIVWSAALTWHHYIEEATQAHSLGAALNGLWKKVAEHHQIFSDETEAYRQPSDYPVGSWLDVPTQDILHRLLWTTSAALKRDWSIIIVYQPSETPSMRVQMRLLVEGDSHPVGGRGESILEAARRLFRNAAPVFARHSGLTLDTDSE